MGKLVCQKLACISFPTRKLPDFYYSQSLELSFGLSLAYFATVHSQVIVGSCLKEYEYKLLLNLFPSFATGCSKKGDPVTSQKTYGELDKSFFSKLFVWPYSDVQNAGIWHSVRNLS